MPFARRSLGVLSRLAPDRRRHKRLAGSLSGRSMRADTLEDPCRPIDRSAGGAAGVSPVGVELTWLSNSADMVDAAERRHEPMAPNHGVIHLAQGAVLARTVRDAAASTKTLPRPQIGTEVADGKTRARVRRHPARGFGAHAGKFSTGKRDVAILLKRARGLR